MGRALRHSRFVAMFMRAAVLVVLVFLDASLAVAADDRSDASDPSDTSETAKISTARALLAAAERHQAIGSLQEGLEAAEAALRIARSQGDPALRAAARAVRGNLQLALGDLDRSRTELEWVIAHASEAGTPALAASAEINLGNLEIARGQPAAALEHYRRAETRSVAEAEPILAAQAAANALRATLSMGGAASSPEAIARTRKRIRELPDDETRALLLIHLATTLERVAEQTQTRKDRARLLREGDALLRESLRIADALDPGIAPRIRAQALGRLGAYYALDGRVEEALELTRRALLQAGQSDSETALYPWQLQSGRLARRLGHPSEALQAYAATVDIIEAHRAALLRSLRLSDPVRAGETLEGVYREYVDLLLRRAQATAAAREGGWEEARKSDLERAQATLEQLKGDELRDYFQDDCVIRYREKLESVEAAAPDALVVYPFVLEDRLELLLSHAGELFQIVVDVDRETLSREIHEFRRLLEKRTTRQYLRPARRIHDWLIAPLESVLARTQPNTLVFVPDGLFRLIPMAALHDGEQFLIERFALGLTPGLDLTDPSPIETRKARVLFAGISDSVQGFAPLPNVEREVESLHAVMGGQQLMNAAFSRRALTDKLEKESFGLVHIASHARFEEGPGGGFLLTHDGKLAFDAFSTAVSRSKFRDQPLELLILSACETAEGDERAALGLSGLAIKAGARSALGSLWQVNDEATAEFMLTFYESLRETGRSRAEAMRAAQLSILSQRAYRHPYFWAPFLMINSWL